MLHPSKSCHRVGVKMQSCTYAHTNYAAIHSFDFEILHKPGTELVLADALSRSLTSPQLKVKATILCSKLLLLKKNVTFSLDNIIFKLELALCM